MGLSFFKIFFSFYFSLHFLSYKRLPFFLNSNPKDLDHLKDFTLISNPLELKLSVVQNLQKISD